MYTSGSTGTPKGVMVEHQRGACASYRAREADRCIAGQPSGLRVSV
ncbi:AMP-binding protein [Corallococcus sp. 4LFB]